MKMIVVRLCVALVTLMFFTVYSPLVSTVDAGVVDKVKKTAKKGAGKVKDKAEDAKDAAKDKAHDVKDATKDKAQKVADKTHEAADKAVDKGREKVAAPVVQAGQALEAGGKKRQAGEMSKNDQRIEKALPVAKKMNKGMEKAGSGIKKVGKEIKGD